MSKKILIIEDEQYLAEMYQWKLNKEGYQAEFALDGQAGVDKAIDMKPDLILLDVVMPVMDGYKTLEVLRKLPDIQKTPIYIFSNLGQTEEIEKGITAGADGYLVKASLTPSQLVSKIDEVLDHQRPGSDPASPGAKKDLTDKCKPANGKKVLVIEDQEDIARMYELRLKKEGYEVKLANNGAWGLELALGQTFDLILLDLVMPALHGLDALKEIKENRCNRDTPVVVLSNSGQEQDMLVAKQAGASLYLIKAQTTPVKLVKKINDLLEVG
jgi:DNA-binding response OmpR family regulator